MSEYTQYPPAQGAGQVHRHQWQCLSCGESMPLHGNSGARNVNSKLTESDVRDIRVRYAAGETQSALARQFGVSQVSVHAIVTHRTWRGVA